CLLVVLTFAQLAHDVNNDAFIGSRESEVRASLKALDVGGPLLTGYQSVADRSGAFAIGTSDDQGLYVYLPWIAHRIGLQDPQTAIHVFEFGLVASIILIDPFMLFELFDS